MAFTGTKNCHFAFPCVVLASNSKVQARPEFRHHLRLPLSSVTRNHAQANDTEQRERGGFGNHDQGDPLPRVGGREVGVGLIGENLAVDIKAEDGRVEVDVVGGRYGELDGGR